MENVIRIVSHDSELLQKSGKPFVVNEKLFSDITEYINWITNIEECAVEYELNYNESGCRWPDKYTNRITTVHKNTITLKVVGNNMILMIDRCWNVYNYPSALYFIYNGCFYHYQSARENSWGVSVPSMYMKINGKPTELIEYITSGIMYSTSVKASKETLQMLGEFFGMGKYFIEVVERRKEYRRRKRG